MDRIEISACDLTYSAESMWQSMETAPKDGTRIIAMLSDGDVVLIDFYRDEPQGWYVSLAHDRCEPPPTYWMPLPPPPGLAERHNDWCPEYVTERPRRG